MLERALEGYGAISCLRGAAVALGRIPPQQTQLSHGIELTAVRNSTHLVALNRSTGGFYTPSAVAFRLAHGSRRCSGAVLRILAQIEWATSELGRLVVEEHGSAAT